MNILIKDGIEFILPAISQPIYKAYERKWVDALINEGTLRFTNLDDFCDDPDPQRGDPLEGTGRVIRQGNTCTTSSVCPIYVCCFTVETSKDIILDTWKDRDVVVQISDPTVFAKRIFAVLRQIGLLKMQVGLVTYNKDEGSQGKYYIGKSIFQKNNRYSPQKEYRFALTGFCNREYDEHLVLEIGNCSDIMQVVD